MKKISIVFISIIVITLFVGCANEKKREYSSNSGRDTVISFGDTDGRFAVSRTTDDSKKPCWILFDIKNQKGIDFIDNYKDVKPYAYTIGEKGYTKLNYEDGKYVQSENLKDFNENDIEIFKKLKAEKIPQKK